MKKKKNSKDLEKAPPIPSDNGGRWDIKSAENELPEESIIESVMCPKCKTESVTILKGRSYVQCQNPGCRLYFINEEYFAFLEYWNNRERLDKLSSDYGIILEHITGYIGK